METGNSSNFLVGVVVSDLSRDGLVDGCQLDQIDWGPWCERIVGVPTSQLSQWMVFLKLDHEALSSNWGGSVHLVPESSGTT